MSSASSWMALRRSGPGTIDIQLRAGRPSEMLRHRIGCCHATSLPSSCKYAKTGISRQCAFASEPRVCERVKGRGGAGTGLSRCGSRERPGGRSVPALPRLPSCRNLPLLCSPSRLRRSVPPWIPLPPSSRPRSSSFQISNPVAASMRRCCAPQWKARSVLPTPMAPGPGRPPTTPVRRPRSSFYDVSVRPCARRRLRRRRCCRCSRRSRRSFQPTRAAPRRARRSSNSRRQLGSDSLRVWPPASRPPISCWSRLPGPASSQFMPSSRARASS